MKNLARQDLERILRLLDIQQKDLRILTQRAKEMQKEFRKVSKLLLGILEED